MQTRFGLKKVMAPEGEPAGGGNAGGTPPPNSMLDPSKAAAAPNPPAGGAGAGTPPAKPTYEANDWRAALPDDVREEPSLKNMNDIPTLVKSYLHAQKAIGSEKIQKPTQHFTDNDWDQFYDGIGRPKLDDYKVNLPKEAKYIPNELVDKLKPIAHKAGIMPGQLEKVLGFYEGEQAAIEKAANDLAVQKFNENMNAVKQEWGQTYDQRINFANRYASEVMGPELAEALVQSGLGGNPLMVKFLAKMGEEKFKEDGIPPGSGGSAVFDPATAQSKANEIIADMSHPYNNPEHPNHKAAVAEVNGLFAMAHPTQKGT